MKLATKNGLLFAAFVALNIIDAFITAKMIRHGFAEANPLIAWLFSIHPDLLLTFKWFASTFVGVLCLEFRPKLLYVGIVLVGGVVIWNLVMGYLFWGTL